jgi:Zn ribbon nucleic-acid-binding protein
MLFLRILQLALQLDRSIIGAKAPSCCRADTLDLYSCGKIGVSYSAVLKGVKENFRDLNSIGRPGVNPTTLLGYCIT